MKKLRGQTGIISKSVTIGYQHVFEVKNTKQEEIKVTLSEQLPLSTDERIKVNIFYNLDIPIYGKTPCISENAKHTVYGQNF